MTRCVALLCCLLSLCLLQSFLPCVDGKRKKKSSTISTKKESLGRVRVLLISPGYPWQFGAYQNQQALLGVELLNRGFDVYWNSAFRQLGGATGVHTALEVIDADDTDRKPPVPQGKQLERANLFSYVGVLLPPAYQQLGRGVLASAVNNQLRRHSIDAVICLMDANQIYVDEPFSAYSIMWFPNHFSSLIKPHETILSRFDAVASLAPSDAEMLKNKKYSLKHVEMIPHIIEKPADLTTISLKVLRKKYHIPQKAWVVLVNCGNYEKSNRKSLDTMLLAFKAFQEVVPEAFLYLKAISSREILKSEGFNKDVRMEDVGLPLPDMISVIDLPPSSYILQTKIVDPHATWELMMLADTLLMPSKTEGFGLPMLEAQLMGVPVVTTSFGAMKDYTINGIAVPPSQPIFLSVGLAVMPDLTGVIAALHSIYAGSLSPTLAKTAIDFIETNLSSKTVGTQFETLIRDGVAAKAVDTLFHRHDLRPTPSSSPTKVRAEHADYGDDTDEYCFSLMSQDPERYLELQSLPKGRIPAWVLLWSNVSTIDWQQIDNIRKQGWGTTIPPSEGDIIFLLTQKKDGSTFPRENDLMRGVLDPDLVVMIRTDRFMPAVKFLQIEAESKGGSPTSFDALRATLAHAVPIGRELNIKVIHAVVAHVKESEERKIKQIVHE